MWAQNECTDVSQEEKLPHNMKSFFSRRSKWAKISPLVYDIISVNENFVSQKILGDLGTSLTEPYFISFNGVYVDLDKRGFIRRSEKIVISSHDCMYIVHAAQQVSGDMCCIFSNHGKAIRFKTKIAPFKSSKRKKKKKKKRTRENNMVEKANDKVVEEVKTEKIIASKEQFGNTDDEDSSDNEDDDEDEFQKTPWHPLPKRIPKSFKYLYSDAYIEKKHSKERQIHLKNLIEDQVVEAKHKPKFHLQTKNIHASNSLDSDKSFVEDEEEMRSFTSPTLGDFFSFEKFDFLKSQAQSPASHQKMSDESNKRRATEDIACEKESTDDNTSSLSVDSSEANNIRGENDNGNTNTGGVSHPDKTNSMKQNNQTDSSIILLSRIATRPDTLERDFKSNYKEASCKPRRFIVNISHLAYQHFVLHGSRPFRMIPLLDLSMYLVFSFVKEAYDEVDEYRVKINTTLQLSSTEDILAPLCQGEIRSVHEIMQQAVHALESLDANQVKTKRNVKLTDDVVNRLGVHSFNNLTSAWKWKIEIMDYPHSLEWLEDLHSIKHLPTLLGSDSTYSSQFHDMLEGKAIQNGAALSRQVKGNGTCKKGPEKEYLCGVCLRDFNQNESSFPLALGLCSHWFCETCWKTSFHFHSNKIQPQTELRCLEEGCTSQIDPISLLTLLPVQVVRDYQSWKWNNALENSPQLKLCPNPACQRIIFAKNPQQANEGNINITCSCLYEMCFTCMASCHWPISCSVANIYLRRMIALNHDNFQRLLQDKELPNTVLKGQSCPKCAAIIPANCQYSGLKSCTCGCVICWPCGEEVNEHTHHLHTSCTQKFQIEDRQLKQRLNEQDRYWIKNGQMTRWYKVALLHRQHRHPQVVSILYKMASHVAEAIAEVSDKGRYVGNVRQAALGWNSHFSKVVHKKVTRLQMPGDSSQRVLDFEVKSNLEINVIMNDSENSPRSCSSMSSRESSQFERQISSASQSRCGPVLKKAIFNIVDAKLELHHIIEHVAVLLEYSHTLHQPGKIIRCLERAEDLSVCLDMLLQPSNIDGSTRIVPSFLRVRSQIANLLSTLISHLGENALYHSKKVC